MRGADSSARTEARTVAPARAKASAGVWTLAWRRLRADRLAMVALAVVAAFLLMLVLSFNLLGDGLRDAMDPRQR